MAVLRLSEIEIAALIKEPKVIRNDFWSSLQLAPKDGHLELNAQMKGSSGSDFVLILRKNQQDPSDFSVILGIVQTGSSKLFRLRRYNGSSHEHTNKIEKNTFGGFHIHSATERYQLLPRSREDAFAEPTDRYADLDSAITCMLGDCAFVHQTPVRKLIS